MWPKPFDLHYPRFGGDNDFDLVCCVQHFLFRIHGGIRAWESLFVPSGILPEAVR